MSTSRHGLPVLAALTFAAGACTRTGEPPARRPEPGTSRTVTDASAPATYAGPDACTECHSDIATRHAASSHALAARAGAERATARFGEAVALTATGLTLETAPSDGGDPPRLPGILPDGNIASHGVTHVLGGRRREAFLTRTERGLAILPLAWSITGGAWTDVADDDLGDLPGPEARLYWMSRRRTFALQCAPCHPVSDEVHGDHVPLSPSEAAALPPGITCEHCHGPAAEHVAARRRGEPGPALAPVAGAWGGCDHCHAAGVLVARPPDRGLRPGDALTDHVLPATLATALGPSAVHFLDGRPASAHGYEVQALAQSACAREGGVTCLTCHDPHGGGPGALREEDPDAPCRRCHAEIVLSSHSHHAEPAAPVPTARAEPTGPDATRPPGCVDCHLPAVLAFSSVDRARDHAIGSPHPELRQPFGVADACSACHPERPADSLAAALDAWFPDRSDRRPRWARAFAAGFRSIGAISDDEREAAIAGLLSVLEDPEADAWTRASAAELLGGNGTAAWAAAPALAAAIESTDDPVLLRASTLAYARVGGENAEVLLALVRGTEDWRVALQGAVALDVLGHPAGVAEIERLHRHVEIPPTGRGDVVFELGMALMRRDALERASLLLAEATRLEPDNPAAWLNLGVARASLGDADGARLAWHSVLELNPGDPHATANLQTLEDALAGQADR